MKKLIYYLNKSLKKFSYTIRFLSKIQIFNNDYISKVDKLF